MTDFCETRRIQTEARLRANPGKPFVWQGMEEYRFLARRHLTECRWFSQLGGDGTDEFIRPDAFTHADL